MTLHLQFLENIDNISLDQSNNDIIEERLLSIQNFNNRFVTFWNKFKVDVMDGETSFYMPVDNLYQLPHFIKVKELEPTIEITETIQDSETVVEILREMRAESIVVEINSRNGGMSFIRLVPEGFDDGYVIIDIPPESPS